MKGMRFLNFSQNFGSGFYPERAGNMSTESIIFKCVRSLRLNLGTGRQRQKFARLLPIRYRFEVLVEGLPANTHCDDYVYPMTHGTFDVEHIGSILDV